MDLDGLVGGFIVFFIVIFVLIIAGVNLLDYVNDQIKKQNDQIEKQKTQQKAKEEHEANLRLQSQFGQNEEYKTNWRKNEKYKEILSRSITAIRNLAEAEEKRVLYKTQTSERVKPDKYLYITFFSNTVYCSTGSPGSDYECSVFSESYEGYNISQEQRESLLRALKEDIEKEIPKLVFNFYYTGFSTSVENYQHYIEKKDIF